MDSSALTERSSRVVVARKLTRRAGRDRAGRFLAEGAQAVGEALAWHADQRGRVHELFCTEEAARRNPDLLGYAERHKVPVRTVTERAAASLSETVTPQGLLATCDRVTRTIAEALPRHPSLVTVLAGVTDPGNAGTVTRVADAAGADAVLFAGNTVDPHNGKCVRASTGSVFHLPIGKERDTTAVLGTCRSAGLRLVAATGDAERDLDEADEAGALGLSTAWVFGGEAHGLDAGVLAATHESLRVPLYGAAESLNLATAAAVCLYASARGLRRAGAPPR